ncbi:MAG: ABC transporter ATP-binding protein [Bacillota bacterium]|nr:ABC transporter ATP-binding protein [Bacillota bacterium]
MTKEILSINNLSVVFNTDGERICALRDLSLNMYRGEILAVVGESGCGKSVLCKTILGLLPRIAEITSGSIRVNGRDTVGLSDSEYSSIRGTDISMVFQDPMTSLDPTYTIGAQISESIRIHDRQLPADQVRANAVALMETVGIDRASERYDAYPWMFSGGMRQRAVLAMALSQDPDILIADEPTTALDVTIQAEILDLLIKLKNERNMGVLFITHDLGVVARVADRVAIMYAGKIVEIGTAGDIFHAPAHPYTWGLLHALPAFAKDGRLFPIPGNPPVIREGFKGDAFAVRNENALAIDYEEEPPLFALSDTHKAATWLADSRAPKIAFPDAARGAVSAAAKGAVSRVDGPESTPAQIRRRTSEAVIKVCNLSHHFRLGRRGIVKAVQNVSFDIRKGEVFALVGESGSGKSTLARCVMGLYQPLNGTVQYNDKYIPDRRRIGFVSQDPGAALNPKMTVRDIIAEPLQIQGLIKERAALDAHIAGLLREVNLDERYMDRYPPELSGGQKQRVNIARAYGMDPGLLVADEPLASLDVSIQAQIVEVFADLRDKHDTAMLFIAHDLSMVKFISDRVGVMYRGRLVELAPAAELFARPLHPYTRSLLSAVPVPDPDQAGAQSAAQVRAQSATQVNVQSSAQSSDEALSWTEVSEGHFVLGGDRL